MQDNFETIMKHILQYEGGYVDHPRDPGGATNMGITFATLQDWRKKSITKADVKALTKAEALEIYEANYWQPTSCDELPSGVDLCVMDSSVNSGIGRGAYWLQRAVGAKVDRKIGTATLKAVEEVDAKVIIERMCDDRMNFLRKLGTWSTFGKGWSARVEAVRKLAHELAELEPAIVVSPPVTIPVPTTRPVPLPPVIVPVEISDTFVIADYIEIIEECTAKIRKLL